VLSYLVEQRRKEIAVRVALGATTRTVAATVLGQSLRPVVLGLIAGAGLAAALATVLLATPLAESLGERVRVFDPLAYAASLLTIIVACLAAAALPALRAARIDPMTTLRQD
jgi:ABC-type antimicrobial peptide transport system permease subunit